jgi:hypothetical protein
MYRKGKDMRKKRHLAAFALFLLFLGRSLQQLNFEMISAETSCWEIERK